jgi:hypothetical protein
MGSLAIKYQITLESNIQNHTRYTESLPVKEHLVLEIDSTKAVNEAPRDNSSVLAWEIYCSHHHKNPTDHHQKPLASEATNSQTLEKVLGKHSINPSAINSQTFNPTYDSSPLVHELQIVKHSISFTRSVE